MPPDILARTYLKERRMDQTLVLVKPDGVRRGLVGEIIRRFENRTLAIKALKILVPERERVEQHYSVHRGKPFFDSVVEFMVSGPVVAMVLEGENAIPIVRNMMGALKPAEAQTGTIRGDYTLSVQENIVHGSDSMESAEREISVWFGKEEILP
jgi:nucleoside-diphosphate kinase